MRGNNYARDPSVVRIPGLADPIKISRRDAIRETALVISPAQRVRASSLRVRLSHVGDSPSVLFSLYALVSLEPSRRRHGKRSTLSKLVRLNN